MTLRTVVCKEIVRATFKNWLNFTTENYYKHKINKTKN